MLFNSCAFAVFLPIVFAFYWLFPHKYRWIVLLVSSYYFYMSWNARYVLLILGVTIITYLSAICIRRAVEERKKVVLGLVVIILLGILFVFKYWNFVADTLNVACQKIAIPLHPVTVQLLLPVGISFYVFQALSYVIDVYCGKVEPEMHFGKYAVFVSFFPQLVAGPIERSNNLLSQVNRKHVFDYQTVAYGLKLMAWGFFKKMVVADNLAVYVDEVCANLNAYRGFSLVVISVFFSLQIYCDFSGYSDIAIGTAKLFGFRLIDNFKSPYFSTSIKEFWKRWHISLSSWFQDYVYIPLGGNRKGTVRKQINLLITFLVSGLWHGAAWHFVIWGGIHGLYRVVENMLEKLGAALKYKGIPKIVKILLVFCCVDFAWIFFRLKSADAWYVVRNMFDGISSPLHYVREGFSQLEIDRYGMTELCVSIVPLVLYDWFSLKTDVIQLISEKKWFLRWAVYYMVGIAVLLLGIHAASTEFIYFQF